MAIFAVLFITVFSVSLMPMLCTFSNLLPKSHFFHYTWSIPVMAAKGRFYLANIHFRVMKQNGSELSGHKSSKIISELLPISWNLHCWQLDCCDLMPTGK